MILETLIMLIISMALITKGADWFVEAAVSISEKSGIPKFIVGATIVSFATTSPELAVSVTAAHMGQIDISVGNAVGSVICNIGIILGLIVAIRAIPIERYGFVRKGAFLLVSSILLMVLTLDGDLTAFDGVLLLVVFLWYMYHNYSSHKSGANEKERTERTPLWEMRRDFFVFIVGASMVVIGSRILVDSAVLIAKILGVPEMLIGLTVVALGTSLPELVTAITSTIKGYQDISVGNILGANILDITFVLGVTSQIRTLEILPQSISYDLPLMLIIVVLLIVFGMTKNKLDRWEGGVLMAVYAAYLAGLFIYFR